MNGLSLGIPGVGAVSPGTHFCALYSGPAERDRLLFPFLEEGLRNGDKCLCLIDDMEPELVRDIAVGQPGPGYSRRAAQLDVGRASDAYLRSGRFSVEDMMAFLAERASSAVDDQFDLLRAAGEMSWVLPRPHACRDLFLYESGLNDAVEQMPAILMCLYDLQRFGADMLVEVLRTHHTVLLDRTVIDNPHYVHPSNYRPSAGTTAAKQYPLVKVDAVGERGDAQWASLTEAELRVVVCVARGMGNRGIADVLTLSHHTVDAHLKHIYVKLAIHSRVELTVLAMQQRVPLFGDRPEEEHPFTGRT